MKEPREVSITVKRSGLGTVIIDGQDVSSMVSSVWLSATPGEPLAVNLTLMPDVLRVEGIADVTASRPVEVR